MPIYLEYVVTIKQLQEVFPFLISDFDIVVINPPQAPSPAPTPSPVPTPSPAPSSETPEKNKTFLLPLYAVSQTMVFKYTYNQKFLFIYNPTEPQKGTIIESDPVTQKRCFIVSLDKSAPWPIIIYLTSNIQELPYIPGVYNPYAGQNNYSYGGYGYGYGGGGANRPYDPDSDEVGTYNNPVVLPGEEIIFCFSGFVSLVVNKRPLTDTQRPVPTGTFEFPVAVTMLSVDTTMFTLF